MEGVGDYCDQSRRLREGESAFRDPVGQIAALDQLRDDEAESVVGGPDIVDRHDVGVVEGGEDAGLGEVGFDSLAIAHPAGVRHLDGNGAVQLFVASQVDAPEAALAEDLLDPVATDPHGQVGGKGERGIGPRPLFGRRRGQIMEYVHGQMAPRRRA